MASNARQDLSQNIDCEKGSDFNVEAGLFLAVGPYTGAALTNIPYGIQVGLTLFANFGFQCSSWHLDTLGLASHHLDHLALAKDTHTFMYG